MLTINNTPVESATLIYPSDGYWTLEAKVPADIKPVIKFNDYVSIKLVGEDNKVCKELKGTVSYLSQPFLNTVTLKIRAGRVDWTNTVTVNDWGDNCPSYKSLVEHFVGSSNVSSFPSGRPKASWHSSSSESINDQLNLIAQSSKNSWWVSDDGLVQFGKRGAKAVMTDYILSVQHSSTVAQYDIVNFVKSGIPTPAEDQVIKLFVDGSSIFLFVIDGGTKRLNEKKFIDRQDKKWLYSYACQIVKQNGKFVDVKCADKSVDEGKGIKNAVLNHGPGMTVEFASFPVNAVLSFIGGDPTLPMVTAVNGCTDAKNIGLMVIGDTGTAKFVSHAPKCDSEHAAIKADIDALKTAVSTIQTYITSTGLPSWCATFVSTAPGLPISIPAPPAPMVPVVTTYSPSSVACSKLKTE